MGHEFIGVIEAVGADVDTVKVGDQCGFGVVSAATQVPHGRMNPQSQRFA